jgi:hypothetical protein
VAVVRAAEAVVVAARAAEAVTVAARAATAAMTGESELVARPRAKEEARVACSAAAGSAAAKESSPTKNAERYF